eukprot:2333614-Alexandrium_andersonii.AAC.1
MARRRQHSCAAGRRRLRLHSRTQHSWGPNRPCLAGRAGPLVRAIVGSPYEGGHLVRADRPRRSRAHQ